MTCWNLSFLHTNTLYETYPIIKTIESAVTDDGDGVVPSWFRMIGYTIGFSVHTLPVIRFMLLVDNFRKINMSTLYTNLFHQRRLPAINITNGLLL